MVQNSADRPSVHSVHSVVKADRCPIQSFSFQRFNFVPLAAQWAPAPATLHFRFGPRVPRDHLRTVVLRQLFAH